MFPGQGNAGHCAGHCDVTLYVGEGLRGSNGACCTLHRTPIFHSDPHNQTGPLWCWFLSKWACAHSRPLWVSPRTSPVRLGVSPATPTPRGVGLSIRGLRLYFPELEHWVKQSASLPAVCPVYLWANVVPRGATRCSACPVLRHSEPGPLALSVQMWGRRVC